MSIPDPFIYIGKRVRVYCYDGINTIGLFNGFCYDFDDDDVEFLEFDITTDTGWTYDFNEKEVERIELLD
ncbi:MAG: hypothetical protein IJT94_06740 [Oscillibacter sp.]|nr:hypothetical protein [Oscillibacter sp.]